VSLGGWHWQAGARAFFDAVFSVTICTAALVLFRNRLNRPGSFARFVSTHAFTVYVIHAVVVTGFGVALRAVTADPSVKFALLAILSLAVSWGLAYLVRALPGAERVL
jgi:glucan biosynthesis protein C